LKYVSRHKKTPVQTNRGLPKNSDTYRCFDDPLKDQCHVFIAGNIREYA
jgi:hypothetical protein